MYTQLVQDLRMRHLLRHSLLIITAALTVVESDLKATASSAVSSAVMIPVAKTLKIASQVTQTPELNRQREEPPIENCSFQPKPLTADPEPITVVKIQVEDSTVLIKVTGSTVLSFEKIINSDEIKQITQRIEGQYLNNEQFRKVYTEVVNAITQLYLNEGYITSKAISQEPLTITKDGVVEIPVIEGRLAVIEIAGRKRLNLSYLCSRIELGVGFPLNIIKIEEQLRLLNADPLLEKVEANLKNTGKPGLSIFTVSVQEASSFTSNFSANNYSPPSLGSERLGITLRYGNLTGLGDEISSTYYRSTTGGANVLDFIYRVPLNPTNGTLQFRAAPNWTEITQSPLDEFDITGEKDVYEITYRQPLLRTLREELALSLSFRFQDGQTFVFDRPTPFGIGPNEDGVSRTSVIQFRQDYFSRDPGGVWFLQAQFNFGTGLFDATTNAPPIPDGHFFNWLGQVRRVQRLGDNHLLIIQGELQLTPDSLLPDQLFIIGGGQSVRGYRTNVRSGDNGLRFSIEKQITVLRDEARKPNLQVAPFLDIGVVWNVSDNPNKLPNQTFLLGAGLGLVWEPFENFRLRLDYGFPFIDLEDRGNNIQDDGLYFELNYQP